MLTIGNFEIKAFVDSDGHLTLAVNSSDGSPMLEIDEDVALTDSEFAVRLTTESIEEKYAADEALDQAATNSVEAHAPEKLSQVDALVAQAEAAALFQATGDSKDAEEVARLSQISRVEIGPNGELLSRLNATYVTKIQSVHTGGGCMVDFLDLWDGRVLALSDEAICVFKSEDAFFEEPETPLHQMWIDSTHKYKLKTASSVRTGDGYTFTRQSDGSYTDGDMSWPNFDELYLSCEGDLTVAD